MSKKGRGVIIKGDEITGYLIIGSKHYAIHGELVSEITTHLHVTEVDEQQLDIFDAHTSQPSESKRDLV